MYTADKNDEQPPQGTVLVVDDEEKNRKLLRRILESKSYTVLEAIDGQDALDVVAATPPDTILLDVMMPKVDGFEVCRRLKKAPETAHIPILLVTMLSSREDRLTGIAAGADDFLSKPVDINEVVLRVRNAIHMKALFDANIDFQKNLEKKVAEQTQELSRAYKKISQKVKELEARDRLTHFMLGGPSQAEAYAEVLDVLSALCTFTAAMILRFEPEEGGKTVVVKSLERSVEGYLQQAEKIWQDIAAPDQATILAAAEARRIMRGANHGTALPVSYGDELLALLWLQGAESKDIGEEGLLDMLAGLQPAIALVLRGAQINEDLATEKIDLDSLINFAELD